LLLVVVIGVLGAAASPAWADPRYVLEELQNANSGKCADILWDSAENGDPAVQYTCGEATQFEIMSGSDDGAWELHIGWHSTLCLEVADYSTDNFAAIQQHDCNGGPHQEWVVVPSGYRGTGAIARWLGTSVMLRNVWSGKCLEVYQYSTENLAYLTQYDCYRGLNQLWFFVPHQY
jgi:hypothetical protein